MAGTEGPTHEAPGTDSASQSQPPRDSGRDTEFGFVVDNLAHATDSALVRLVNQSDLKYKDEDISGEDLWQMFIEDFVDWTPELFRRLPKDVVQKLRNRLWNQGVFSPKDRGSIVEHVIDLFNREKYRPWPADVPPPKGIPFIPLNVEQEGEDIRPNHPQFTNAPGPHNQNVTPGVQQQFKRDISEPISIQQIDSSTVDSLLAGYYHETFSRQLIDLNKLYDVSTKYAGRSDVFDYRFKIFVANCSRAGVPKNGLTAAFETMLKDEALDFYQSNRSAFSTMDISMLTAAFKSNFEGREHRVALQQEWNDTSLQIVINKNKEKSMVDCLDIMLARLRILQQGLFQGINTEDIVINKLTTACSGVKPLKYATRKPSPFLTGLINDLRSSAALHDREQNAQAVSEAMFTDRKFFNRRERRGGKPQASSRFPKRVLPMSALAAQQHQRRTSPPPRQARCAVQCLRRI